MVPTFPEGSPGPGTSLGTAHPDADQTLDAYALPGVCVGLISSHRKRRSVVLEENPELNKTEQGVWRSPAGLTAFKSKLRLPRPPRVAHVALDSGLEKHRPLSRPVAQPVPWATKLSLKGGDRAP